MTGSNQSTPRHTITVETDFVAQHYLTVPDPEPPEGEVHSHHYTVEITLGASELGEHGYLVDINELEAITDEIDSRFRDRTLNELRIFPDGNPSLERFAAVISDLVASTLCTDVPTTLTVGVREDDVAWTHHRRRLDDG